MYSTYPVYNCSIAPKLSTRYIYVSLYYCSPLHEFRSQIRFVLFRPNPFFSPNHIKNMGKIDVSALKIAQSHTKIQYTPSYSPERTLLSPHRVVPSKTIVLRF